MTWLPPLLAVAPALPLLILAQLLRSQGGRMRPKPRPASRILAHCHNDRRLGLIPGDFWGDTRRPLLFTVPREAS